MKKILLLTFLLIYILGMSGCGRQNTEEILTFQKELNSTLLDIENIHTKINSVDTTSLTASEDILAYLSELNTAFHDLSQIKVSDANYSYITDLAIEGSDYMEQAYDLFEKAYGGETFDENNADLAYKYLERATKRIRVIVTMLHGEIPDDVIVH